MKFIKRLLIVLLAVSLILGIGYAGLRFIRRPNYDLLTELEISSSGGMTPSGTTYRLELVDGVWVASVEEREGGEQPQCVQKQLGTHDVSELKEHMEDLLEGRPAWKWSLRDYIQDMLASIATDQPTYRFRAVFSDGRVIEGSKYGRRPYGFYEVWNAFEDLF